MIRFLHDLLRVGILLVAAGVLLYLYDPTNSAVFQALLIGLFLVGGSHVTRRLLFPSLDLQTIAKDAVKENNVSSALVFCAIIYFLVAVMDLSLKVLR